TTPPTILSAPTLTPGSDSGASNSDRITKVTTPTFTGTAENGSTVKLFVGASQVGSATANAVSGVYSVTSSAQSDGIYSFTVTATDVAGNISGPSPSASVTIDTSLPAPPAAPALTVASDSGVSSSDRITNVTTPTFTGTAESNSTVTLFAGAGAVGTATTNG